MLLLNVRHSFPLSRHLAPTDSILMLRAVVGVGDVLCRPNAVCQDREGGIRDHSASGAIKRIRTPHEPFGPTWRTRGGENVAQLVSRARADNYSPNLAIVGSPCRATPSECPQRFVERLDRGRHYTWPASSLPYQLEMAMRKVQVKKDAEKAAKKARAQQQQM